MTIRTARRLVLTCIVGICLMGLFGSAHVKADQPVVEETSFVVNHEVVGNCGDFLIIADGRGTTRLTTFFDKDGVPIKLAFQGRYKGTLTNSVTGFALLDDPSVANIFIDLVKGTQTNIGAFFTVTTPHGGTVLIEAGRIVFDINGGDPLFIAGPHRPPHEQIAILCEALR